MGHNAAVTSEAVSREPPGYMPVADRRGTDGG